MIEVLALPCKHEDLNSVPNAHAKSWTWLHGAIIPVLGSWGRQIDPWILLATQSTLFSKLQVPIREPVKMW